MLASHDPRPKHTVHMLDDFDLKGPNGFHKCLIYELLGPNVPDVQIFQMEDFLASSPEALQSNA